MWWKIIQATTFLTVTAALIYVSRDEPADSSFRNPFGIGAIALLATLFVTAIPTMASDARRLVLRLRDRGRRRG